MKQKQECLNKESPPERGDFSRPEIIQLKPFFKCTSNDIIVGFENSFKPIIMCKVKVNHLTINTIKIIPKGGNIL